LFRDRKQVFWRVLLPVIARNNPDLSAPKRFCAILPRVTASISCARLADSSPNRLVSGEKPVTWRNLLLEIMSWGSACDTKFGSATELTESNLSSARPSGEGIRRLFYLKVDKRRTSPDPESGGGDFDLQDFHA